jgi:hypothetical protein
MHEEKRGTTSSAAAARRHVNFHLIYALHSILLLSVKFMFHFGA